MCEHLFVKKRDFYQRPGFLKIDSVVYVKLVLTLHLIFSDVRQVPDNQEVFSHSRTDQSLIIEILESAEGTDEQAIK